MRRLCLLSVSATDHKVPAFSCLLLSAQQATECQSLLRLFCHCDRLSGIGGLCRLFRGCGPAHVVQQLSVLALIVRGVVHLSRGQGRQLQERVCLRSKSEAIVETNIVVHIVQQLSELAPIIGGFVNLSKGRGTGLWDKGRLRSGSERTC